MGLLPHIYVSMVESFINIVMRLIFEQEITRTGALEHSSQVFNWMKNQELYRARTDIYNDMICMHVRHDRVEVARALFKEMQKWRFSLFHCD